MGKKLELKVGDKVRVIRSNEFPEAVGKIYNVTTIMLDHSSFVCRISGDGMKDTLMFEYEIEKLPAKGTQLLFSFMQE